jgi:hypothetical protein
MITNKYLKPKLSYVLIFAFSVFNFFNYSSEELVNIFCLSFFVAFISFFLWCGEQLKKSEGKEYIKTKLFISNTMLLFNLTLIAWIVFCNIIEFKVKNFDKGLGFVRIDRRMVYEQDIQDEKNKIIYVKKYDPRYINQKP